MARIFVVFLACAAVGIGMLIWYASELTLVGSYTFNSELNLYPLTTTNIRSCNLNLIDIAFLLLDIVALC